jgi:hypothetical protein
VNKELAIAILEDMIGDCKGNCLTKDKEALEYAIQVLKKDKEESTPIKEMVPEVEVLEPLSDTQTSSVENITTQISTCLTTHDILSKEQ